MILLDPLARPVIAHRGASGEYPENTLLAFARGLEQGADALELDVRLTADGVPVVLHDATLERTTDQTGPVSALAWRDLRRANAGRGERIPALAEVLERFPKTPLLIEVKDRGAGGPVLALLRKHHAERRVLVGAFRRAALRPFLGSECARAPSRAEVVAFWAGARLGLPWRLGGYRAFSVPERSGPLRVVDGSFVRAASRAGLPVHVWTVNDPSDALRLRALGVCGIITNYPGRMRGLPSSQGKPVAR